MILLRTLLLVAALLAPLGLCAAEAPGATSPISLPPTPGQNHRLKAPDLELIWIAPGTFRMGSEKVFKNEKPVHAVTLSAGYWFGKTEVTQAQWQAVMGGNPSQFKGDNLPVEKVSWEDAWAFCQKLTEQERAAGRLPSGYSYCLPTEAEWEYACRAGTSGDYAGELSQMAWYNENSSGTTHAVSTKEANAWGLYDMHGNVWEWCADRYGGYDSSGMAVTNPMGSPSGASRVSRGGGWNIRDIFCRSAYRDERGPLTRDPRIGFRLALSSVRGTSQ